jgi:antitoxin HigA-1
MKITPIHPGEVLAEDFMAPRKLTANALALALRVPSNRNQRHRARRAQRVG